ncbi:hypothetical protein GCM10011610_29980 [Nocardia rhizosphaerihabitans]|uniref:Uncharacterized protein n=2 Tax=Nocardia rhizosphaerihabitans TaxID=1691570 RepID=A0ABQ2KDV3_9NOCA|nr:hypothetical protein GCM10011610_29980 [Nocardia rhizosphaerihabitans]
MVTAGGVKLVPPAIGPGTVRTTFPPDVATVPATVPPEAVAETKVEFAGVGMVIFRLLMLFTVKPDAELGTDEAPGVIVMATAEPDAAELGAVPVTDVFMLEVWPIPKMVPRQLQFTLTGAAFTGAAKQNMVATATGARNPARKREEVDLMAISRISSSGVTGCRAANGCSKNIARSSLSVAEIVNPNMSELSLFAIRYLL